MRSSKESGRWRGPDDPSGFLFWFIHRLYQLGVDWLLLYEFLSVDIKGSGPRMLLSGRTLILVLNPNTIWEKSKSRSMLQKNICKPFAQPFSFQVPPLLSPGVLQELIVLWPFTGFKTQPPHVWIPWSVCEKRKSGILLTVTASVCMVPCPPCLWF